MCLYDFTLLKHVSIPWTFLKRSMIYLMNNLMMTEDFITLFTSFSLVQILYKPGWSLVDGLRNVSIPLLILSVQGNYCDLGEGVSISYTVCRQACCHKSNSNWTPKWQIPGIHTEPVSFLKCISETEFIFVHPLNYLFKQSITVKFVAWLTKEKGTLEREMY